MSDGVRPRHPREITRTFEPLEARFVLSSWTHAEAYLADAINRVLMDPLGEAGRLGVDLTADLHEDELLLLRPRQPLALSAPLTSAARAHSQDMWTRGFFGHVSPDGLNPAQRAQAAGYAGTAAELIAQGFSDADQLLTWWLGDADNRVTLLGMFSDFDAAFRYTDFGLGEFVGTSNPAERTTLALGIASDSRPRLLGTILNDTDGNGRLTLGEGVGGVRLDVALAGAPDLTIGSFTTLDAGAYALTLDPGSYVVTITDIASGFSTLRDVTLGTDNVKLDVTTAELTTAPYIDDHADASALHAATPMVGAASDGATGAGAIGHAGDTDAFSLTTDQAGDLTITLSTPGGGIVPRVELWSAAGLALAADAADADSAPASVTWFAPAGTAFYIIARDADGTRLGQYSVLALLDPHTADDPDGGDGGDPDGGDGGDPDGGDGGDPDGGDGGDPDGGDGGDPDGGDGGDPDGGDGGDPDGGDGGDPDGGDGGDPDGGDGGDPDGGGNDQANADPPALSSDGSGALAVARVDDAGNLILLLPGPDGSWTSINLRALAGGPTADGRIATYTDPATDRTRVVSATDQGVLVYELGAAGAWTLRNLSAELGAETIGHAPVTFIDHDGRAFVAGLSTEGRLIAFEDDGGSWALRDLSGDLDASGLVLPDVIGTSLIAYVTAWNALTIAGIDVNGGLHAIWRAPGMERWTVSDLGAITGAPAFVGRVTAYLTPWSGINIAGTDERGDLAVAWWVPEFGGEWRLSLLNELSNGPRLDALTVSSYVTPWGGLNVVGVDPSGAVVVYWWAPGMDAWVVSPLSDLIGGVDVPRSGLAANAAADGTISLVGSTDAGELVRYWWRPGAAWTGEIVA